MSSSRLVPIHAACWSSVPAAIAAAGQGGLAGLVTFGTPSLPPCDPHVASGEAETNPQICHWEPFSARDFKGGSRAAGVADASLKGPHHFLIQSRAWEQLSSRCLGGRKMR